MSRLSAITQAVLDEIDLETMSSCINDGGKNGNVSYTSANVKLCDQLGSQVEQK